jgi:hypothetical protein
MLERDTDPLQDWICPIALTMNNASFDDSAIAAE